MDDKKAAIWARVSTTGQAETSIPSQIERSKVKADSMGYIVPKDYILSTDKSSLQLKDDPQLFRLYDLITKHKITAIFLLDRDRLSAEPLERLSFISLCKENGVTIIPAQGPELLDSDEGQLVEMALALGKKKSVIRAQLGAKQGLHDRVVLFHKPTNFHHPYGYVWKGNDIGEKERQLTLVPDDKWENVKLIFDSLLDGKGYDLIIKELRKRGILSPSGQTEWNKAALSFIAHSPTYAGRFYSLKKEAATPKKRKTESKGKSSIAYRPQSEWIYLSNVKIVDPPITWEQRQKILDQIVSRMKLSKRHAKNDYLLRAFIYCHEHYGKGGRPRIFHGYSVRNKYYYCCPEPGCRHRYIPGLEFETYVKTQVAVLLNAQPDDFYQLSNEKSITDHRKEIENELLRLQKKHDKVINAQAKVAEDHYSERIKPELYQRLYEKYEFELTGIENQRNDLLKDLSVISRQHEASESLKRLKEKYDGILYGANDEKINPFSPDGIRLTNEQWREIFSTLNIQIRTTTPEERESRIRDWLSSEYDWLTYDTKDFQKAKADKKFNPFFDTIIKVGIPLRPHWLMEVTRGEPPDNVKQKLHGIVIDGDSIGSINAGTDKPNKTTYPLTLSPLNFNMPPSFIKLNNILTNP